MPLSFCPKCSNLLIPEKLDGKGFSEICKFCGYSKKFIDKPVIIKEKIPKREKTDGKILEVKNEFADYKNKCQKCGYNKAQIIDMGIFYSDEDNLILLKCGKCGWSERIGRKVS